MNQLKMRAGGQACAETPSRALLVTYTRNNEKGIERKFYEHGPAIPPNIAVMTWFRFLLRELARPYAERNMDGPWLRKSAKVLL